MTKRRSRFVRNDAPAAIILTERDHQIIRTLYAYRWLRRCDLCRLIALPSVTLTNLRLRALYDGCWIDRIRAGTVSSGLAPIYIAGEASIPLLALETGLPERDIRQRIRRDKLASPVLLPHDLTANTVRAAIVRAVELRPEVTLDCWHDASVSFDAYSTAHSLRPDGYFRLIHDQLVYSYFLEVDLGTTDLQRFRKKCEIYCDYRGASGAYVRRYALERFRVLTTAPDLARLGTLQRTARQVSEAGFWFTLTSSLAADGDPFRAIWHTLRDETPRSLLRG